MGPHPPQAEQKIPGWDIWSTPTVGMGQSWSAKPAGATAAVVFADSEGAVRRRIFEYVKDVDAHVREAREKLDKLPPHWTGERAVQEALIAALAELVRS